MIEQKIECIAKACNGIIINKGIVDTVSTISTDTRIINEKDMFIALVGENFDGHMFIRDAIKKGASVVIIQEGKLKDINEFKNITIIEVKDTLEALKDISKYYRNLFNIPFIGVTGSVGKTTTKDLISGVLSSKYNVHKNIGNFNNQIGLPLTLFNLDKEHKMSVLEMGMSSYGEILDLANIVNPEIGVITNIGESHIENFGNKENIMKAKMEITNNFTKENYLLVNGDDQYLKKIDKSHKNYAVIFYGLSSHNDFHPIDVEDFGEKGSKFTINIKGKLVEFKIKQPGLHNVYNGLAAIWVGLKYNMTIKEIQKGLDSFEMSKMRLEITNENNIKIINDAYNASPDSMKAALDVLDSVEANRKIAILGNMFEMGDFAEKGHRSVGEYLCKSNVDVLITVGKMAKWIGLEAKEKGFDVKKIFYALNNQEAINLLNECIKERDAVLVKGSRSMAMEEIVEFLQERR